jgi:sugar/nucleoside kinase (ribokinase family)
VTALGVIGKDGHGYELKRELGQRGIDIQPISERAGFFTPTYTKPLIREADGRLYEIERQDIKNRTPLPDEIERQIIEQVQSWAPKMDGVVVVDQVQEENCGVVTRRVCAELETISFSRPQVVFAVDSRVRIGSYRNMVLKPNRMEAVAAAMAAQSKAVLLDSRAEAADDLVLESGRTLAVMSGKPVFLTQGERGVIVFTEGGVEAVPAVPVRGPVDPVGAGDSFIAGLVLALCSGAAPVEAAFIGNLVAAVTIQQIGTTGVATSDQLWEMFNGSGFQAYTQGEK